MIENISIIDTWPYFLLFLLFAFWASKEIETGNHQKYGNYAFITILLFSICRYNIGADYPAYWSFVLSSERENYEFLSQMIFDWSYEQRFPPYLFMAFSIITLVGFYYFISRQSQHRVLSWYLYFSFPLFCFQDFSTIRQAASIGLVLVAASFTLERKYKYAIPLLLTAPLFHSSAWVGLLVLLAPLLGKLNLKLNVLLFVVSFIAGQIVVDTFLSLFEGFLIAEKFLTYVSYEFAKSNTLQYLIYMVAIANFILFYPLKDEGEENVTYIGFVTLGAVLFNLFQIESQTARRLATYFLLFELLLIPALVQVLARRITSHIIACNVVILNLFALQLYYISQYINAYNAGVISSPCFVPYDFWWNHIRFL